MDEDEWDEEEYEEEDEDFEDESATGRSTAPRSSRATDHKHPGIPRPTGFDDDDDEEDDDDDESMPSGSGRSGSRYRSGSSRRRTSAAQGTGLYSDLDDDEEEYEEEEEESVYHSSDGDYDATVNAMEGLPDGILPFQPVITENLLMRGGLNFTDPRKMTDAEYVDRILDPALRPLIDDLAKRMPQNPMAYMRRWLQRPPPLNATIYERRRYYDRTLAPIVHSLVEEAIRRRPADILKWLRTVIAAAGLENFDGFDPATGEVPLAYRDHVASDETMLKLLKAAINNAAPPRIGGNSLRNQIEKILKEKGADGKLDPSVGARIKMHNQFLDAAAGGNDPGAGGNKAADGAGSSGSGPSYNMAAAALARLQGLDPGAAGGGGAGGHLAMGQELIRLGTALLAEQGVVPGTLGVPAGGAYGSGIGQNLVPQQGVSMKNKKGKGKGALSPAQAAANIAMVAGNANMSAAMAGPGVGDVAKNWTSMGGMNFGAMNYPGFAGMVNGVPMGGYARFPGDAGAGGGKETGNKAPPFRLTPRDPYDLDGQADARRRQMMVEADTVFTNHFDGQFGNRDNNLTEGYGILNYRDRMIVTGTPPPRAAGQDDNC
eukprot:g971.t1